MLVNKNTLYVGYAHIFADSVNERNVARKVFALGNERGEICRLKLNCVNDLFKSLDKLGRKVAAVAVCFEISINVILLERCAYFCNRKIIPERNGFARVNVIIAFKGYLSASVYLNIVPKIINGG